MITNSTDIVKTFAPAQANTESFFTGGLNFDHDNLNFDPIVTGYAFILWTKIPAWLEAWCGTGNFQALTQKNFKSFDGISDMELQSQAYSYGFNNNEYNVVSGITKNNTEFTMKHQEYSGSPIKNIYQYWQTMIVDPETGIASYPKIYGVDYAAKNHTGELLYVMTRPDADNFNNNNINNIEFAAYYTNVFPTKIPLGNYNYSQGDHNLVEIDIPFKGNMHIGPKVDAFAKKMMQESQPYNFNLEGMYDPTKGTSGADWLSENDWFQSSYGDSANIVSQGTNSNGAMGATTL